MIDRLRKWTILSQIFLLPLIPAVFGKGYEEIKVLVLLYSVVLLTGLFLLQLKSKQKLVIPTSYKLLLLFLGVLVITALTGINPEQSLLGTTPYFQGVVTFVFLSLLSFIVINTPSVENRRIIWGLLISAIVVSGVALFQYLQLIQGQYITTYAGRVVSTFGQPNFYAGFLLLCIPFVFLLFNKAESKIKIVLVGALMILSLAIAVSFSRTAIIYAALLTSWWLTTVLVQSRRLRFALWICVAFGLVYALIPSKIIEYEIVQPLTRQTVEFDNVQKRVFIWQAGLEQIVKRPILGYGLENISTVYPEQYDFNHPKPAFYHSLKDLQIDNTHNLFLNLMMWGGVVLTAVFLFLFIYVFRSSKNNYYKLALIVFLFWAFFQNLSAIHWLFFYLLIALITKDNETTIDSNKSNHVQLKKLRNK